MRTRREMPDGANRAVGCDECNAEDAVGCKNADATDDLNSYSW